ncbi:hypothetical protein FJ250_06060 [bacterium]|nr:hypothetical protein [bacterium]
MDKTELVRTALDSSLSNLTQTRDMQEELTANLSVLADSLRIASGLIDSLRTASRTSLGTLQQLQFPVRIESVAWVDSGGHFPNELFRDICECYPHDVFPGNFVYDTVHENGIQPIYFWYVDTPDVRIGTPLKLERALSIPKGSDILSWLYNCESVDAVSRRAEYNIRQLEFSRDSELAAASVLRDSAQANRFDDPAWPQRARVEREREEVLRARQFFLDRLARCDDDRLAKWVLDYFHETVGNVTPADSLEFARTALRAQIRVLDGRVERMFAERDPQADQRLASRMLGAVRSLGFGNPGVRWLTFFAHLPQVNGTHKWSSDREAELVFMSGDLALYAKDEVMEYFYQPSGKFSYAKAGGAESLAGFYQELSRIPYPASLELNFATGEVYRHFEVDVQVVNSTGQFSSVCDLEGSWLAIPSWQLPVPLQLVFAFPDGKKLQVLGTEFKEGPYDWWWAQINRGHLSAFPLCRE